MEFASEMVVRSALAGLKIVEVPTTLKVAGRSRAPHLKTWRDGWRHLKFLLMYSPRWLFAFPGAACVALGALVAAVLSFGPLHFQNNVVLDLNTYWAACLWTILGTQLLTFGALSRYYAAITGFLPSTSRASTLVQHATTDRLVWVGGAFFVVGLLLFGSAMIIWGSSGFGPITTLLPHRTAAAGLTAMVIGIQTFFSAFLLGVLTIPIQPPALGAVSSDEQPNRQYNDAAP
jgi:hypothetical protein